MDSLDDGARLVVAAVHAAICHGSITRFALLVLRLAFKGIAI